MKLLAIIPAYNEEACLEQTILSLMAAQPSVDVLVVNDGSRDKTRAICEANGFPHVNLPINCGLACAFQTGMKYALRNGYDAALQFDADGQHLPEFIGPMAQALEASGADIVIASRVLAGTRITGARGLGSHLISALIRATSGTRINDPTSGMRMYNRRMIRLFADDASLAPEPDTLALVARKGGTIVEVPASMRERQGGQSYLDFAHVVTYMSRTCLSILLFQWFK